MDDLPFLGIMLNVMLQDVVLQLLPFREVVHPHLRDGIEIFLTHAHLGSEGVVDELPLLGDVLRGVDLLVRLVQLLPLLHRLLDRVDVRSGDLPGERGALNLLASGPNPKPFPQGPRPSVRLANASRPSCPPPQEAPGDGRRRSLGRHPETSSGCRSPLRAASPSCRRGSPRGASLPFPVPRSPPRLCSGSGSCPSRHDRTGRPPATPSRRRPPSCENLFATSQKTGVQWLRFPSASFVPIPIAWNAVAASVPAALRLGDRLGENFFIPFWRASKDTSDRFGGVGHRGQLLRADAEFFRRLGEIVAHLHSGAGEGT